MEVKFYDIQKWSVQPWYNTGGTRDKKYVQSPEGEYYYFKTSIKKPGKDFRYEFWSEVIAYQVGKLLGFDILPYDVAYDGSKLGCLSKSMFIPGQEELIEGVKYIQAFDNTFDPQNKSLRQLYSFQLIVSTLRFFEYEKNIKDIIEIIVFDALIGNSDRHQENWSFITKLSTVGSGIKSIEELAKRKEIDKFPSLFRNLIKRKLLNKDGTDLSPEGRRMRLFFNKDARFAPIYDSGSSLGRELTDQKINSMLQNKAEIESYINRGASEIHWNDKKLRFFDLITEIQHSKYSSILTTVLTRLKDRYHAEKIEGIVQEVDNYLPYNLFQDKIPDPRKLLISKLITLRFEKLMHFLA